MIKRGGKKVVKKYKMLKLQSHVCSTFPFLKETH